MIGVRVINGNPMMFVAELNGHIVGTTCATVIVLIHDMEIESNILSLPIADALYDAAEQKVKEAGFDEVMVLVEDHNLPMQRYLERRNAKEEPLARTYTIDIPS